MTKTMYQENLRQLTKELKRNKDRQVELTSKISKKLQEGADLVGEALFQACFDFFIKKSQFADELSGKDMQEIQDFVDTKISQDKTIWVTQVLFTMFYSTEDLKIVE